MKNKKYEPFFIFLKICICLMIFFFLVSLMSPLNLGYFFVMGIICLTFLGIAFLLCKFNIGNDVYT